MSRNGELTVVKSVKNELNTLSKIFDEYKETAKSLIAKLEKDKEVLLDCRCGNQRCHECPDLGCGDNLDDTLKQTPEQIPEQKCEIITAIGKFIHKNGTITYKVASGTTTESLNFNSAPLFFSMCNAIKCATIGLE